MPTTPHPITGESVPLTLGHEFSGVVEEVGEGIDDLKVGARIVVQPIIYDGTCGACKEGLINCCDNNGFVGLSGNTPNKTKKTGTEKLHRLGWRFIRARCRPPSKRVRNTRRCFHGGRR